MKRTPCWPWGPVNLGSRRYGSVYAADHRLRCACRLSTLDLVLLRLRNMALEEGNDRAFEELHRLIKAYQPQATHDGAGCLVVSAELSQEEWVADQMEKNKHRKPPPGYIPKGERP